MFADNLNDWKVQQHFLIGSERSLNEAQNQVLMVEAVKATGALLRSQSPASKHHRTG